MSLPSISVIAPSCNRWEATARTLHQLLEVDYPSERFEILVADSSTDRTPEVVAEIAAGARVPIRLLQLPGRYPAAKRNAALRAADGDLVLFMNDDLWVRPDFLAEHAATHAAWPEPVAVLGHCTQSPEMPPTPFVRWYEPFAYHEIADRADQPVDWRYCWSMNLSLPREVMLARNLVFHEDWAEIGHEDVELGYRWVGAGYRIIYNPRAFGEHYHPHTLDSACRVQAAIGRGLRDLEVLVPERGLHERYGLFTWHNRPRSILRGLARGALFNRVTVPVLQPRLGRLRRRHRAAEWMYWKVLLHHTTRGYRSAPRRQPTPVPTRPLPATSARRRGP